MTFSKLKFQALTPYKHKYRKTKFLESVGSRNEVLKNILGNNHHLKKQIEDRRIRKFTLEDLENSWVRYPWEFSK